MGDDVDSVGFSPHVAPNFYPPQDSEEEVWCEEPEDVFIPASFSCDYETLLSGFPSNNFQDCKLYTQWLSLIPTPYLANPVTKGGVDLLLNQSHQFGLSPSELVRVYRSGPPDHSLEDRLARVRVYLIFKEALDLNHKLTSASGSHSRWKVPSISSDFDPFAKRVMEALKEPGAVNVKEVPELWDELGFSLSGLFQELDNRTVSLNVSVAEDQRPYVVLHEMRHWYNVYLKKRRSYEEEELEAAYLAMKAFLVLKGDSEIHFGGGELPEEKWGFKNKFAEIDVAIQTLPKNLQTPIGVVWGKVKKFASDQLKTSYIQKVFKAAYFELTEGYPHQELLAQAGHHLELRRRGTSLVLEMDRLIRRWKQEPIRECRMGLDYIVYLALQNQISLALHELDKMMKGYKEGRPPEESLFGTP